MNILAFDFIFDEKEFCLCLIIVQHGLEDWFCCWENQSVLQQAVDYCPPIHCHRPVGLVSLQAVVYWQQCRGMERETSSCVSDAVSSSMECGIIPDYVWLVAAIFCDNVLIGGDVGVYLGNIFARNWFWLSDWLRSKWKRETLASFCQQDTKLTLVS